MIEVNKAVKAIMEIMDTKESYHNKYIGVVKIVATLAKYAETTGWNKAVEEIKKEIDKTFSEGIAL